MGIAAIGLLALLAKDNVPVGWPASVTTWCASTSASADNPFTATVR